MASYCATRYDYGKRQEIRLIERLEDALKEQCVPTTDRYSVKDYTSETYNIELKSRRAVDSNKYNNWLIPVCKFKDTSKKMVVFYHWEGDDTLWKYHYNPDDVQYFVHKKGPISDQDHYTIPKRFFSLV